jgi:OOP family OmpA-OmpF porin
MKKINYLLIAAAGLALGACASGDEIDDVNKIRTVQPQGGTPFTQALATAYQARTVHEADDESEWSDASWYARKGLRAANGEVVLPSEVGVGGGSINRWGYLGPLIYVRGGSAPALIQARQHLMTFLDGGGRERAPFVAANAQAFFDCWLEESWEPDDTTLCHTGFAKYEAQFTIASVAATSSSSSNSASRIVNTFQVFFDFDRSNIATTAAQIIDKAAASAKEGKMTRIDLTGHTDSSGTDAYNQALSERRATAVKKQLIEDGVPADEITTVGVGKAKQLVPTADGVREPQNRRTEIILH